MQRRKVTALLAAGVLVLAMLSAGCAKKGDMLKEISGTWEARKGNELVKVQLVGDTKSVEIDGQKFPVKVDKINPDAYTVAIQVQDGSTQTQVWTLQEVWDDNGESFDLALNRGQTRQMLKHKSS